MVAWFTENWQSIMAAAFSVMVAAQVIVRLTPTPADDVLVGKVYRWLEGLAGVVGYNGNDKSAERS